MTIVRGYITHKKDNCLISFYNFTKVKLNYFTGVYEYIYTDWNFRWIGITV